MEAKKAFNWFAALVLIVTLFGAAPVAAASEMSSALPAFQAQSGNFSEPAAFDVSPALSELVASAASIQSTAIASPDSLAEDVLEIRPDRGALFEDTGFSGDGAVQGEAIQADSQQSELSSEHRAPFALSTLANFEGISNQDNFNIFGGRVNPPDPVGDVGKKHYVEMVNLAFAVYSKTGDLLLGPADIGSLWAGFAIEDCTDPSGDPIVLYDQFADRWILSQFTTRGLDDPTLPFYNCVAISQTGDPTGAYYRYAFTTGLFFPDYPKYGIWRDTYIITTREFGPTDEYGIGVYGLERERMIAGDPAARVVSFFLDGNDPAILPLVGDGLLPPDTDGREKPSRGAPAPIVGTQDDDAAYGATFDAVNIWEFSVKWRSTPVASIEFKAQLPVAEFDSVFPCAPTARDCLPQPGITDPNQYLDILSYRQRPTWRLAYRNFKFFETMVTNQSVEAAPGVAGVRWYEIRRIHGKYFIYQQGTFAPNDGVHRWMGSIAQDKWGNIALGYSVTNATDVYPGIRFTGRMFFHPLGQMTLGEGVIVNGSGVQTTTNSRWGDYTSMNVDPVDDCTFWYVNEYYEISGLPLPLPPPPLPPPGTTSPWQTRIASFKLPGCR
jgi:hypothetical protein